MQLSRSNRSRGSSRRNRHTSTSRPTSTLAHGSMASSFLPVTAGPKRSSRVARMSAGATECLTPTLVFVAEVVRLPSGACTEVSRLPLQQGDLRLRRLGLFLVLDLELERLLRGRK